LESERGSNTSPSDLFETCPMLTRDGAPKILYQSVGTVPPSITNSALLIEAARSDAKKVVGLVLTLCGLFHRGWNPIGQDQCCVTAFIAALKFNSHSRANWQFA
jgi:hypothetical protein